MVSDTAITSPGMSDQGGREIWLVKHKISAHSIIKTMFPDLPTVPHMCHKSSQRVNYVIFFMFVHIKFLKL